jgi:two-component system chemotaxis sensor kinase CheA
MAKFTAEQIEDVRAFSDSIYNDTLDMQELLAELHADDAKWDVETLNEVFRFFHNIKGTGAMFDLTNIVEYFHFVETLANHYRSEKSIPCAEDTNLFLQALYELSKDIDYVITNSKQIEPKNYKLLLDITNRIDEVKGIKSNQLMSYEQGDKVEGSDGGQQANDLNIHETVMLNPEASNDLIEMVSDYIQLQNKIVFHNQDMQKFLINDMDHFSKRLQSFVLGLRVASIKPLFNNLFKVGRETASSLGKNVEIKIQGGDTQIERGMIQALRDPLVHVVRNAIDHGIETESERNERKKKPVGSLIIDAFQRAGQVIITISDDGRGLDLERVKDVALKQELVTEQELAGLTDHQIINFITMPGFSTREDVTELSGRGVGMDVVKTRIEEYGGTFDIESSPGNGCRFTIVLPVSLAVAKTLVFRIGEKLLAAPQLSVEEVITNRVATKKNLIKEYSDGSCVFEFRNNLIPILPVDECIGVQAEEQNVNLVIRHQGHRFVIRVDEVLGSQDFVAQALPEPLNETNIYSSVNNRGDGKFIFLLDLNALMSKMYRSTNNQNTSSSFTEAQMKFMAASDLFRSKQKMIYFKAGIDLAIPIQLVKKVDSISKDQIFSNHNGNYAVLHGKTYEVMPISKHFNNSDILKRDTYELLIINRGDHEVAIVCDKFYGVKNIPKEFETDVNLTGTLGAIYIDNSVFFVLNVNEIFEVLYPEIFTKRNISEGFHILIAEDDPFFATSLTKFFNSHGFSVTVCEDGEVAMKKLLMSLHEDSPVERVDYVIFDYDIPNMKGLQLLEWIRKHDKFHNMPVSFCTAVGTELTKQEAMKKGIDVFTGKMKYQELLTHIEKRRKTVSLGYNLSDLGATQKTVVETEEKRLLTFNIGDSSFALPIENLIETSFPTVATDVPSESSFLCRIVHFRGVSVPVLDLRVLFRDENYQANNECHQIIGNFGGKKLSLWVDSIEGIKKMSQLKSSSGLEVNEKLKTYDRLIEDILCDEQKTYILLDDQKIQVLVEAVKKVSPSQVAA